MSDFKRRNIYHICADHTSKKILVYTNKELNKMPAYANDFGHNVLIITNDRIHMSYILLLMQTEKVISELELDENGNDFHYYESEEKLSLFLDRFIKTDLLFEKLFTSEYEKDNKLYSLDYFDKVEKKPVLSSAKTMYNFEFLFLITWFLSDNVKSDKYNSTENRPAWGFSIFEDFKFFENTGSSITFINYKKKKCFEVIYDEPFSTHVPNFSLLHYGYTNDNAELMATDSLEEAIEKDSSFELEKNMEEK